MPIIKIYPSKRKVSAIINYVSREGTVADHLIETSGCSKEDAERDFKVIADYFNKTAGVENRSYYHIIVSYNTTLEKISPEEVRDMVAQLCRDTKIDNYQWYLAVHTDRLDHLHAHVVINNVSYKENTKQHVKAGRSFQSTVGLRKELMERGNQICKEHGYERSLVNTRNKAQERLTRCEMALIAKGEISWKDRLRAQIESAKERAQNPEQFKEIMQNRYQVQVLEHKGAYRYVPKEFEHNDTRSIERGDSRKAKPCHERRLGDLYTKDTIEHYLKQKEINQEKMHALSLIRREKERSMEHER